MKKLLLKTLLIFFAVLSIGIGAQVEMYFQDQSYILSDTLSIFWGCYGGPFFGALVLLVYLLAGVIGLPVFAESSSGWEVITGSSGGYLIGFFMASLVAGILFKRVKPPYHFIALPIAQFVIYFFGVIGLLLTTNLDFNIVLQVGVIDFLPGATIKLIMAALLLAFVGRKKGERDF